MDANWARSSLRRRRSSPNAKEWDSPGARYSGPSCGGSRTLWDGDPRSEWSSYTRDSGRNCSSNWWGKHGETNPTNTVALLCGPEVMMRFAVMELQKRGVPQGRIYLSMERNMKCALGYCGHCQYGPTFVCKDGPVFRFDSIASIFGKGEI
jgi:hypothetical protein